MGGEPATDLLGMVVTCLREVLKTVNGQFISKAPDTEQYYLDLKKDIDYDAQIDTRADALSDDALDRAYFSAIRQLMERTDESHLRLRLPDLAVPDRVAGAPRRAHRLPLLRRTQRPADGPAAAGLLHLLHPALRAAALPRRAPARRGVLPAEGPRRRHHAQLEHLRRRPGPRRHGQRQRQVHLPLQGAGRPARHEQMAAGEADDSLEVTYGGKSKPLQDWVRGVSMRDKARLGSDERINFRDVVNVVSGLALGQHFADLAPEYPAFSLLLTEINRKQYVGSACAGSPAAPAPRTRSPCWMPWRCWTATASSRPAPAMPRRS
jgi:hypothetical protein